MTTADRVNIEAFKKFLNDPEEDLHDRGLFPQLVLIAWCIVIWLLNKWDGE